MIKKLTIVALICSAPALLGMERGAQHIRMRQEAREMQEAQESRARLINLLGFNQLFSNETNNQAPVLVGPLTIIPPTPLMPPTPTTQASDNQSFDKKEALCVICQENMTPGQSYSCMPCQHAVHFECFQRLSQTATGRKCPVCRNELSDATIGNLAARPSGAILPNEPAAPASALRPPTLPTPNTDETGFFSRMKQMFTGSEDARTAEQKIKSLAEALSDAQRRIIISQDEAGRLMRLKIQLEERLGKLVLSMQLSE